MNVLWLYLLTAVGTFFLWATIHELAHLVIYARMKGFRKPRFFPYPHKHEGKFYFARFSCEVDLPLDNTSVGFAAMMPWFVDGIAAIVWAKTLWLNPYATIILFGGIVDLLVASVGFTPTSDLQVVAKHSGMKPWALRGAIWLWLCLTVLELNLKLLT